VPRVVLSRVALPLRVNFQNPSVSEPARTQRMHIRNLNPRVPVIF
jgi:hypothetical protein